MTLLAVLALGFFLGMRHATDSDHVVAVAAIVTRSRSRRAPLWIGMLWGIGHSTTVLAVGGALIFSGWVIPPRLGLAMEMGVAVMLILLGMANLTGALARAHNTGHEHIHGSLALASSSSPTWYSALRPVAVGIVHGMAGSAAIALLVLATIKDARLAVAYLAVFGVGTVAGMTLITLAMAVPLAALSRRMQGLEHRLARVAGAVSLMFGLFLAYRIGIADGLLSNYPHWSPH